MHHAIVLAEPAPLAEVSLDWREVETPEPSEGQLRIRVAGCGVCRSNLHMIEGDWVGGGLPAFTPIVPGHEVTGIVDAVGAGVEGFQVGDRVGTQPLWWTCEECEHCLGGREQYCARRITAGERVDGGYAEYMLSTAAHTYRVPPELDLVAAAPLFCPGITAYTAVSSLGLRRGERVAVFGLGGVGHMAVQFAALAGAEVTAVARNPSHLEAAGELGATTLVDVTDDDAVAALRGTMDAAVLFAPSDAVARTARASVRLGGRIVSGVNADFGTIRFAEGKSYSGSLLGSRAAMHEVLALAAAGRIRTVVEEFPLREAREALDRLARGEIRSRGVLRMMDDAETRPRVARRDGSRASQQHR
ncbi:alcohol dehydrogenase catalytic domain-containing protein [Microbacterium sp. KHB019]|uniref:alcohol dehydrogenase catalytic domain-containing protein n=1 Tax=Microbacterium sp. KHB019 TaxID=3129770 RepID=UPI00307A5F81